MRSSQVTIKDIARELGISPSTVSRALKDHPDISKETKKAVNDLAKQLNYQPNAVALSLKHSKRFTIGIIIPQTVHYFFSTVISGIEDVAYNAGYNVMICQSNERFDREKSNANMLYSNRVDGILVSISKETRDFDHLKFFKNNNIPIVFFDRAPEEFSCDQVIIDDYKASYEATSYLIKRGHTRLAHLAAPSNLQIGKLRQKGFMDAVKDNNLPLNERHIIQADNYEDGRKKVMELFATPERPDGIFTVNDLTALGVMSGIKEMGYRIPEDVGVVGFSNGQYSNISEPNLTTIDQNGYEMGKTSAELLLRRINSDKSEYQNETHIIETRLVIRDSTR